MQAAPRLAGTCAYLLCLCQAAGAQGQQGTTQLAARLLAQASGGRWAGALHALGLHPPGSDQQPQVSKALACVPLQPASTWPVPPELAAQDMH